MLFFIHIQWLSLSNIDQANVHTAIIRKTGRFCMFENVLVIIFRKMSPVLEDLNLCCPLTKVRMKKCVTGKQP